MILPIHIFVLYIYTVCIHCGNCWNILGAGTVPLTRALLVFAPATSRKQTTRNRCTAVSVVTELVGRYYLLIFRLAAVGN